MLSNNARTHLRTKFETSKSERFVTPASTPRPQTSWERPALPRAVTPSSTVDVPPATMKTVSDNIQLVQAQCLHDSAPHKPATKTVVPRASNLYQAISPSTTGRSTLTLSRGDSRRKVIQASGERKPPTQAHPASTLEPRSYPTQTSLRRLQRGREDDDGLDQPTIPSRERRSAATQNTLTTSCRVVEIYDEQGSGMAFPPARDDQDDGMTFPPPIDRLIDLCEAGASDIGSWSAPSATTFGSSEASSNRDQRLVRGDGHSAGTESLLGTKRSLVHEPGSEVSSTSSPIRRRSVSIDFDKESVVSYQQVVTPPSQDDVLNDLEETPSTDSETPVSSPGRAESSILDSVSSDSGAMDSPSNQVEIWPKKSPARRVRKPARRKVQPQSSFLEGNLSQMGSLYFGSKPTFKESTKHGRNLSLSKCDPRKVIDKHLRTMGKALGQRLSLNRRGICYFYYEELFVHVEVNEQSFMISSVLHQLIPGKDDDVQADEMLDRVRDVEHTSSEPVKVSLKNKRKFTVSCARAVPLDYEDFLKYMNDFRDIAVRMKEKLKPTSPGHPYPTIVEF